MLFAAGAFAALGTLNVWALLGIFITAAILGDALNYAIGNYAGKPMLPFVVHMATLSVALNLCSAASSFTQIQEEAVYTMLCSPVKVSQIHSGLFISAQPSLIKVL